MSVRTLAEQMNMYVWGLRKKLSPNFEYDFDTEGELVQDYVPINWTTRAKVNFAISTAVGAIVGAFIALIINGTFVELALNQTFSVYFGVLMILMGALLMRSSFSTDNNIALHPSEANKAKIPRYLITGFAILNVIVGTSFIFFEFATILFVHVLLRFAIFIFLGMSLSFSLTYAVVDFFNFIVGWLRPGVARPLIDFALQVHVVILTSLLMGGSFGYMFGLFDYQTYAYNLIASPNSYLRKEPLHLLSIVDLKLSMVVGGLWGALAGMANEYIQQIELAYNQLDQPIEFETDI